MQSFFGWNYVNHISHDIMITILLMTGGKASAVKSFICCPLMSAVKQSSDSCTSKCTGTTDFLLLSSTCSRAQVLFSHALNVLLHTPAPEGLPSSRHLNLFHNVQRLLHASPYLIPNHHLLHLLQDGLERLQLG